MGLDSVLVGLLIGWFFGKKSTPTAPTRPGGVTPPTTPTGPNAPGAPATPHQVPWPTREPHVVPTAPGTDEEALKRQAAASPTRPATKEEKAAMQSALDQFEKASSGKMRPKKRPTQAEVARAKQLLAEWRPGGVWSEGVVQYRASKHGTKKAIEVWEYQ